MAYQHRYICFCRAHNLTPGLNFEGLKYIAWINSQWREWDSETGHSGPHFDSDHSAFDAWLDAKTSTVKESLTVA